MGLLFGAGDGAISAAPPSAARQLTTAGGPALAAKLVGVDQNQHLLFDLGSETRKFRWNEIVTWGTCGDVDHGSLVLLADGGWLAADILSIDDAAVVLVSDLWAEARFARESVRAILFRVPGDAQRRDRLFDAAQESTGDAWQLVLENGDEMSGTLAEPVRADAGGFRPTALIWQAEADQPPFEVSLDRVVGLFLPTDKNGPVRATKPERWVGFQDGSCLAVTRLECHDDTLALQLACGTQLSSEQPPTPQDCPWGTITFLQSFGSQVTYLSDLEPLSYRQIPYLGIEWPYRLDRSVLGERLRCGGRLFLKGLGMHGSSRLSFELAGEVRRFQADLAIDQSALMSGSVVFRVYTRPAAGPWRLVLESDVIRGGQLPVSIDADISGAKQLALIVDASERGDVMDRANWLNARVLK
jgi:hypothetical protein